MPRDRDEELLQALGSRLRELRADRGLTQEQLAEQVKLRTATISDAERGQLALSLANLAKIAHLLGATLPMLLDFDAAIGESEETQAEQRLLTVWRTLDPEKRELAIRLVGELSKG